MKAKIYLSLSILFVIGLAVLVTIYGAWVFYPLEINVLKISENIGIAPVTIEENFNVLLNYLTKPWVKTLDMPLFPSSADGLHHFAQVKDLFHLAQAGTLVGLIGFILYIKSVILKGLGRPHRKIWLMAAATPAVIALLALLTGFNTFFTLFHQVLFLGDQTWLFDPSTDPVIQILPEAFFMHCFLVFLAVYECLCLIMVRQSRRDQYGILRDAN